MPKGKKGTRKRKPINVEHMMQVITNCITSGNGVWNKDLMRDIVEVLKEGPEVDQINIRLQTDKPLTDKQVLHSIIVKLREHVSVGQLS